jgi:hypothetical protein
MWPTYRPSMGQDLLRGALGGGGMDETDRRRPLRRRNLDVSFINKFVHRGPAAPLGCRPPVLYQRPHRRLDSSAQLQLESTAMIFRPRLHAQAKYYLQLNIFTTSISFVHMLYMFFLLFQSPSTCSGDWQCQHVCAMFPSPSISSGAWPCQSKGR